MANYTAQVHYKDDDDTWKDWNWKERMSILPTFKSVANIKKWVLRTNEDMNNVREVCILRINTRTGRTKIHGYYDWNGKTLVLNKGKDAFVHNIFYELD